MICFFICYFLLFDFVFILFLFFTCKNCSFFLKNFPFRTFHNFLPKTSVHIHWISVRNFEIGRYMHALSMPPFRKWNIYFVFDTSRASSASWSETAEIHILSNSRTQSFNIVFTLQKYKKFVFSKKQFVRIIFTAQ